MRYLRRHDAPNTERADGAAAALLRCSVYMIGHFAARYAGQQQRQNVPPRAYILKTRYCWRAAIYTQPIRLQLLTYDIEPLVGHIRALVDAQHTRGEQPTRHRRRYAALLNTRYAHHHCRV